MKKVKETDIVTIGTKHLTKDGIWSCIFFLVGTVGLVISFWNTLWDQSGINVGILGIFILIISVFGLSYGIRGRKKKNCSHIIDEIGIASNVLLIIILVILFIIGIRMV
ncbi:hypothetical protein NDGK_00424 [Clostridiales bacterium CHKCI001]|nr:hypothetical protein NDGK_00424 [Clostridiales bacterium CHKCI001]